jgi:hypothetical protein
MEMDCRVPRVGDGMAFAELPRLQRRNVPGLRLSRPIGVDLNPIAQLGRGRARGTY